jgi:MFS family permease
MLILVSEEVLMMGSIGLGLLYASRGMGTGIGPVIGRRIFTEEHDWVRAMGLCMIFGGAMYAMVGITSSIVVMLFFVFVAHAASGANWVMSTVLLQRRTPDPFRGRIFSTDWLLFTLAQSASLLLASWLLENRLLTIQQAMIVFSLLLVVAGLIWHFTITSHEEEYQEIKFDLGSREGKTKAEMLSK